MKLPQLVNNAERGAAMLFIFIVMYYSCIGRVNMSQLFYYYVTDGGKRILAYYDYVGGKLCTLCRSSDGVVFMN